MLECRYHNSCSGCDWLEKPAAEQRELKLAHFRQTWAQANGTEPTLEVGFVAIANGGLRDRVDLIFDRRSGSPRFGLFDREHSGIVDLETCPQLSPPLDAWLSDFRRIDLPIERGSVRLRVSPQGQRGVWLDFANLDVKRLLDERKTLESLREAAIVEIGQRRKRLIERDGVLKLADPVLEPWFETTIEREGSAATIALYCTVGSFTQPGFVANRALRDEIHKAIQLGGRVRSVAEFGSGIGNFTLPLAAMANEVHAYEVDALALEGLTRSADHAGLSERIVIHSGNFQVARKQPVEFKGIEMVFADPPRSGLMQFLDPIETLAEVARPASFLYVSCFSESFANDCARLARCGYRLRSATLVDIFPQSRHYEIVARLDR